MSSVIFTDGHPIGLNGQAGLFADSGYSLVQLSNGERRRLKYEKPRLTNNEAEIVAIIHAASLADKKSKIYSDSKIAIDYATHGKGKIERLAFLGSIARALLEEKEIVLSWTPRENNPVT